MPLQIKYNKNDLKFMTQKWYLKYVLAIRSCVKIKLEKSRHTTNLAYLYRFLYLFTEMSGIVSNVTVCDSLFFLSKKSREIEHYLKHLLER